MLNLIFCHNCRRAMLIEDIYREIMIYLIISWNGTRSLSLEKALDKEEHDENRCPFCRKSCIQPNPSRKILRELELQI